MSRTTIDYGIDLGTTNSSIAVLKSTSVEVIKNFEGFDFTPSAVWIDPRDRVVVGRESKQHLDRDNENAFSEFKSKMGKTEEFLFQRSGRRMKPEDLSAEVLKQLKRDVQERQNEEVQAAVITVPAAFELPQCAATQKAAQLAGFKQSPLIMEPVAAALAYGFESESNKVFWLVYDFGGGTFDAAVVQVRDGDVHVVNHKGDNQLGGKLLDWAIVEELLIPTIREKCGLTDFHRGNPRWKLAISKLKLYAEEAKIRVSRSDAALIDIDYLCNDEKGAPVHFQYELQKAAVEQLFEPFVYRSINICRDVLAETHLAAHNLEKILLVGGPTLTPYLRERLADPKDGLGIPLEFTRDPLTVVAQGAAIFAGTQRFDHEDGKLEANEYRLELDFKPMGPDQDPLVSGRASAASNADMTNFTIEFINLEGQPQWRSGLIGLSPAGDFVTNLWAERGKLNTFQIELRDAKGGKCVVSPDLMTYRVGIVNPVVPAICSVGVALANNDVAWMIQKGCDLPAKGRYDLCLVHVIDPHDEKDAIHVPIVEGDNERADRNELIGELMIPSARVRRELPPGSSVEMSLEIDQSRNVHAKAYVPLIDEEFDITFSFENYRSIGSADELRKKVERQKTRLAALREKAGEHMDAGIQSRLARIDSERMLHDIETALNAAANDSDAADKCEKRLRQLTIAVDELEDLLEWPSLVAAAMKEVEVERNIIQDSDFKATADERGRFSVLEAEINEAISSKQADLLRNKVDEMDNLGFKIIDRYPGTWVGRLTTLEGRKASMSDQSLADTYVTQGRRAINNNDLDGLKAAVRQLASLLPRAEQGTVEWKSSVVAQANNWH